MKRVDYEALEKRAGSIARDSWAIAAFAKEEISRAVRKARREERKKLMGVSFVEFMRATRGRKRKPKPSKPCLWHFESGESCGLEDGHRWHHIPISEVRK